MKPCVRGQEFFYVIQFIKNCNECEVTADMYFMYISQYCDKTTNILLAFITAKLVSKGLNGEISQLIKIVFKILWLFQHCWEMSRQKFG